MFIKPLLTTGTGRHGEIKTKPLVIYKYNGIDKADQHAVYYSFGQCTIKWWWKLMLWLFEVAIVNSYILYKMTVNNDKDDITLNEGQHNNDASSEGGERHDTIYYCGTCTNNPTLHVDTSFE